MLTKRACIRQFRADDAAAFHSWRDDERVARYMLWDYPYSMEMAEAFCTEQALLTAFPVGEWCQLMIEDRGSGRAIGDIGLGIQVDGDDSIELGYSLHPSVWGRGLITEILSAVLPVLAAATGVVKFTATVDARNPASRAVLRKLGFEEGPLVPRSTYVKGEWCDEYHYKLMLEG